MNRGGWSTWRWPIVIGLATFVGLLVALLVGGLIGSAAGWIGLAVPVVCIAVVATVRHIRHPDSEGFIVTEETRVAHPVSRKAAIAAPLERTQG